MRRKATLGITAISQSKKSTSRDRIIRAASDLFGSSGYYGAGLNEIVRQGKAPKGSIYYHFPGGKEQIAAEAILLLARSVVDQINLQQTKKQTASEAVRLFVETLSTSIVASGYRSGGALAIVASESATTNKELNRTCQEAYGLISQAISGTLSARGFPKEKARTLSVAMTAAVEGGIVLSRTYHSRKPLQTVAKLLGDMVKAADPL